MFLDKVGRDLTDVFMISDFSYEILEKTKRGKEFIHEWNSNFGRDPDFFSVMAYDATRFLAEALKRVKGRITGRSLREELVNLKGYDGLLGSMSFSETGEIIRPLFTYNWIGGRPNIEVLHWNNN